MINLLSAFRRERFFNLEEENRIYEEEGLEAYSKYQIEHENDILQPGTAFPLVKALQKLNADGRYLTEIIFLLRNNNGVFLTKF